MLIGVETRVVCSFFVECDADDSLTDKEVKELCGADMSAVVVDDWDDEIVVEDDVEEESIGIEDVEGEISGGAIEQ